LVRRFDSSTKTATFHRSVPLFAALCLLVAIASIGAFFGQYWWALDALAAFRPHLAGALAVGAAVLFTRRWHKLAALTAVVALANAAVVLPLFVGPFSRPAERDLRVISFNVLSDNTHYEEVIAFIEAEQADVVILHETSRPWEQALAAAGLDYQIVRGRNDNQIFGSMVLAPAGSEVQSFGFGVTDPRAIEVALPSGVRLLGIHPLSPYSEARTTRRQIQYEFAALWAAATPAPKIITGDFNAGPWSYPFRNLLARTGLLNSQAGYGLELSYPAQASPLFQVAIDHLLHSSDLAVVDRRLGPPLGSDHLPLIVDLAQVGD
jgi:endonuclease/exonuclease/phosphatase (EEP) superfamily protein YafD